MKFTIHNSDTRSAVTAYLAKLPDGKTYDVTITPRRRNRTVPQNRLYWLHIACLSDETGQTVTKSTTNSNGFICLLRASQGYMVKPSCDPSAHRGWTRCNSRPTSRRSCPSRPLRWASSYPCRATWHLNSTNTIIHREYDLPHHEGDPCPHH